MIGIDLFCGAGGMTLGARQAGIDVIFAVENDKYSAMTYLHNNPGIVLFNDDIRKLKSISFNRDKQPLVVFGGPPCQGFSTSNQKTRTKQNPNNWLFSEFIRIVKMLMPDWVVFENVTGFKSTQEGIFFEKTVKKFENLGYTVTSHVLNSVDYEVPQKRSRVFVIASLHGIKIEFPKNGYQKVTVKDAISDLPVLENGASINILPYKAITVSDYAKSLRNGQEVSYNNLVSRNRDSIVKRYKYIPQGGNWQNIPARLMKSYTNKLNCHSGIYHRLKEDEPSVVIGNYRKNMLIHPIEDRGLSVRESCKIAIIP